MIVLFDYYRSKRERLRLTIQTYRDMPRIDLRMWYVAKDGELKPGRVGFTGPSHVVVALTDALAKAVELAEASKEPTPLT